MSDDKHEQFDEVPSEPLRGTEQWNQGVYEAAELAAGLFQVVGDCVIKVVEKVPADQLLEHINDVPSDLGLHIPDNFAMGKHALKPVMVYANFMQNHAHFSADGDLNPTQAAIIKTVDDQLKSVVTDAVIFGALKRLAPKLSSPVGWGLLVSDAANLVDESPQYQRSMRKVKQQINDKREYLSEASKDGDWSAYVQNGLEYGVQQDIEDNAFLLSLIALPSKVIDAVWTGGKEVLFGAEAKLGEAAAKNGKKGVAQQLNTAVGVTEVKARHMSKGQKAQTRSVLKNDNVATPLHSKSTKPSKGDFMKSKTQTANVDLLDAHKKRFEEIKKNIGGGKPQIQAHAIMGYIKDLHQDMLVRQKQEKTQARQAQIKADFEGIQSGFNMIAQIGSLSGNKGLQRFGAGGAALAQGLYGLGQLTGSFGITAVSGFAMLTPATAVLAGGLAIVSLFRRGGDKQAKAMMRALKGISNQISDMHKDMHNGIEHIVNNQRSIFTILCEGFQAVDFRLFDQEQHLNRMDEKLDKILQELQELNIRPDKDERRRLFEMLERFEINSDSKYVIKILQSIRHQLTLASSELMGLPERGNHFSGWYHLTSLKPLFELSEFMDFHFEINKLCNLTWAELPLESAMNLTLLTLKDSSAEVDCIRNARAEIFDEMERVCGPTASFVRQLSSRKFLDAFFNYYQNRLNAITARATTSLDFVKDNLSKTSMQNQVKAVIAKNGAIPGNAIESIKSSIISNTMMNVEQVHGPHVTLIQHSAAEYNSCLKLFQRQFNIITSVLGVAPDEITGLVNKIGGLTLIPENRYRSNGVKQVTNDKGVAHAPTYSYLDMCSANHFKRITVTNAELATMHERAEENSSSTCNYLEGIQTMVTMFKEMTQNRQSDVDNVVHNSNDQHTVDRKFFNQRGKVTMKNSDEMKQMMTLLKPILEAAKQAEGKKVVYVMGVTGDGKSTLLNYLNGTNYEKGEDDFLNDKPEWNENLKPEVCETGNGGSTTKVPKLIDVAGLEFNYCDMPGSSDSDGRADNIAGAFCPYFINKNAAKVKGIVWVLNVQQFTATRGEKVKEILANLLAISDGNLADLAESITIVATRAHSELKSEAILKGLSNLIKSRNITDPKQIELLNNLLGRLQLDTSRIVISNVFDHTGENRRLIHQSVAKMVERETSTYDFSAYSKDQRKFEKHLVKAAEYYISSHKALADNQKHNKSLASRIDTLTGAIGVLKKEILSYKGNIKNIDAALKQGNQKLGRLKNAVESKIKNEETIELKTYQYDHKAVLGPAQKLDGGRVRRDRNVPGRFQWFKGIYESRGYSDITYTRPGRNLWIFGKRPANGTETININYPADFPIEAKYSADAHGFKLLPNSIDNTKGYKASFTYELGRDMHVSLTLSAKKKDTKAFKDEVGIEQAEHDKLDKKIEASESSKVTWASKVKEAEQELKTAQEKLKELKAEKVKCSNDIKENKDAIQEHAECFSAVYDCCAALGIESQPDIKQFMTLYDTPKPEVPINVTPKPEDAVAEKKGADGSDHAPCEYSEQSVPRDRHFYTDEEVDTLMKNYVDGKLGNVVLAPTTIGHNDHIQGLRATLVNKRDEFAQAGANNARVFIPVNVGNLHWILVVLDYSRGATNLEINCIDPLGGSNTEVGAMIKLALGLPTSTLVHPTPQVYQNDGYNCGPWIVELARHFSEHGSFPQPEAVDIDAQRQEQQEICAMAGADDGVERQNGRYDPGLFGNTQAKSKANTDVSETSLPSRKLA